MKRLRSRKEAKFSRICSRADTLISSQGSKRELRDILKEIDAVFEEIVSIQEEYEDQIQDSEEHEVAVKYIKEMEEKHKCVTGKIRSHLELRVSDSRSDISSVRSVPVALSLASAASRASAASKEAQIGVRLHQMRLQQLERRLEEERRIERQQQEAQRQHQEAQRQQQEAQRQQREMERLARLAEARDAATLAAKEAELRKAAESDLAWDRVDDFCDETAAAEGLHRREAETAGEGQERTDAAIETCPNSEDSAACRPRAVPISLSRGSESGCQTAAANNMSVAKETPGTTDVPVLPPRPAVIPTAAEPKRTESNTSWIYEIANRQQDASSADHAMGGNHNRSVPQIQLPKFSGKAIEWPQ